MRSVGARWYTGPMLHELRIENLLLIDRAELHLAPGLNVVTGETGAGKTLLAQSLDLLLGGRAGAGVVRSGAREAYVEGVFSLPDELAGLELLPEGAEEIVLARRVWPDGRTRAYVCGRSATVADLREFGSARSTCWPSSSTRSSACRRPRPRRSHWPTSANGSVTWRRCRELRSRARRRCPVRAPRRSCWPAPPRGSRLSPRSTRSWQRCPSGLRRSYTRPRTRARGCARM